jgi:hypothetical protein
MPSKYGFELDAERAAREKREEDLREAPRRAQILIRDLRVKPIWQRVMPIIKLILEDFAKARGWNRIEVGSAQYSSFGLRLFGIKGPAGYSFSCPCVIEICIDESTDSTLRMSQGDSEARGCHCDSDLDALGQVIANETKMLVTAKEEVNPGESPARWKAVKNYKPVPK